MTSWIVVGAGSAGCVVARRLVDAGHEVVLVEAGPADPAPEPERTGPDPFALHASARRTHDGLVARRTAEGPLRRYVRGRGVGGSSAVDAMVALPCSADLPESWGWTDWSAAEARALVPRTPTGVEEYGRIDRALVAASSTATPLTLHRVDGRRVTADDAYLRPIADEPRLTVLGDRLVDRVDVRAGAVSGVRLADGTSVAAPRVVVSAGAIHTPAILQRSGLVAGVGVGLQDHPSAAFLLDGVPADGDRPPAAGLAAATILRDGPIDVLPLNHLGAAAPTHWAMLMVALMRPVGRTGTVRLRSPDPHDHPVVEFDLLRDRHDMSRLVAGVRATLQLLRSAPFAALDATVYVDDHGTRSDDLDSDEAIAGWLRREVADYVHASGSCAEALGEAGRVRGVDGLFVCDASAFPSIPDANTHHPTTVLAERFVGRWIAAERAAR